MIDRLSTQAQEIKCRRGSKRLHGS